MTTYAIGGRGGPHSAKSSGIRADKVYDEGNKYIIIYLSTCFQWNITVSIAMMIVTWILKEGGMKRL